MRKEKIIKRERKEKEKDGEEARVKDGSWPAQQGDAQVFCSRRSGSEGSGSSGGAALQRVPVSGRAC
jgi:hypothetical protein